MIIGLRCYFIVFDKVSSGYIIINLIMKKIILLTVILLQVNALNAQVIKSIVVSTAGTLTTLLSADEKASITQLTVTGKLNARDFKCFRDEIINLAVLDISATTIDYYSGFQGTRWGYNLVYPANEIPQWSFYDPDPIFSKPKLTLKTIKLPPSLISIGKGAFSNCTKLTQIIIPEKVMTIGSSAFSMCESISNLIIPNSVNEIGDGAFSACGGLKTLMLGDGLVSIGPFAFSGCEQLTTITCLSYPAPTLGFYCFFLPPQIIIKRSIYVPAIAFASYESGYDWSSPVTDFVMVGEGIYIKVNVGDGGSVTENNIPLSDKSQLNVTFPETKTFTIIPNPGYEIATLSYNGADVKSQLINNTFTTPFVANNSELNVSFAKYTDKQELINSSVKVFTLASTIVVEGTNYGETISLYSMTGKLLSVLKSEGERILFKTQADAVYLVRVGKLTYKVTL